MNSWHDLVEPASVVGGFATGFAVAIAILALIPGVSQIIWTVRSNREAGALQAHREYLRLCFENPEFSSTALFLATHPEVKLASIENALTQATEKYLWFLSIVLSTCEQIVLFVSSSAEWRALVISQLQYHASALELLWPSWAPHYSTQFDVLVREAITRSTQKQS